MEIYWVLILQPPSPKTLVSNIYANSLYFSLATSTDNRISDLQRDELQNLSGSLKSLGIIHI